MKLMLLFIFLPDIVSCKLKTYILTKRVHVLLYRIENISMKLMLACFFLPDIVSCKLKTYILTKIYMYVKLDENEHAS